jgi:hypothetical protein
MWKPYKGLNDTQIKKIQSVYLTLRKIQDITGVPWQAMAGIWFRESFSVAPPKEAGGPWQFDPIPATNYQRWLLDRFTKLSEVEKDLIINKGVNDFFAGGVLAACFFRTKTVPVVSIHSPDEVIKDAIWGYNGKAYGSADNSPYVMNGWDESKWLMEIRGTINGKSIKRPDGTWPKDARPGAFVIYKQLLSLFPNSASDEGPPSPDLSGPAGLDRLEAMAEELLQAIREMKAR